MSTFKNTKENAKRRKITDALRTAAKKERILEGFQCPHKRCMHILKLEDYKAAGADYACGRCAANIEEFTPLFVDLRRITPKDILKHDVTP
jgi:transcription initiation factor IIE alpha subunit